MKGVVWILQTYCYILRRNGVENETKCSLSEAASKC